MYWNIYKTLSYNAYFNFIVGNRGGGKTYGAKKFCIDNFLKKKEQFIYVRRYKEELKKIKNFFNDIKEIYPQHEFKVLKGEFIIDNEIAGFYLPLSTAKIQKSNPFPDVTTIIFDEFILDKGVYNYIYDEVTNFLDLVETVFRSRDNVRTFLLSNALTITNPYFLYFNLKLPYMKNIICKNDILLELVQNSEYIKMKENTRFGKIIKNTSYGDYAINNSFLRDDKNFIEKKTGNCAILFSFIYKGKKYGVWVSYKLGLIWVSNDIDPSRKFTYAITKEDHTPNTLLLNSLNSAKDFKFFIENYKLGNVRFENMNIKNICYEIVKLAHIY